MLLYWIRPNLKAQRPELCGNSPIQRTRRKLYAINKALTYRLEDLLQQQIEAGRSACQTTGSCPCSVFPGEGDHRWRTAASISCRRRRLGFALWACPVSAR